MQAKPDEILRDKENKIKQLFSEFESLKKKIFVCEQQRREDAADRHRNSDPRKTVKAEQPRQSLQPNRQDSEKDLMRVKLQKYEQLLREKTELFEGKERYLNKALKQQKISLEMMRETYERKLRRAGKVMLPFTVEDIVSQLQFDSNVELKVSVCEKRMGCLTQMLSELRRGVLLKLQKNAEEMDDIIEAKLSLEIALAEKEDTIERMERQLSESLQNGVKPNELMEKLSRIEAEREEETALLNQKIKELEGELQEKACELQKAKQQYDQGIERLQEQFREQLKSMSKKQQLLQEAQGAASSSTNKLMQSLREKTRSLEEKEIELTECRSELRTMTVQNEELKLNLETLSRQNKLTVSNYESRIFTLTHELEEEKKGTEALGEQLSAQKAEQKKRTARLQARLREAEDMSTQQQALRRGEQSKDWESKLKSSLQQLQREKEEHSASRKSLNERAKQLEERLDESQRLIRTKDEQLESIRSQLKKLSQQSQTQSKPASNPMSMQTRKQIQRYQAEIQELKIILQATQSQLEEQERKPSGSATELQSKVKLLTEQRNALQKKVAEKDRQLAQSDRAIKRLEQSLSKSESKQKATLKQLEDKQQAIDQLKERKAGFETLAIEIERGNDLLKQKLPLNHHPRNNRIVSGINDIFMRQTKSDTEQQNFEERIDEIEERPAQKSPISRGKQSNMMYSYNPTNQRYLQEKIKELEKELELAVAEKEFLNTKKHKLEEDINSFELDQQRFEGQKQLLKQQVNRLNHELTMLKAEARRLLTLLLSDSKKAFKSNILALKECFNKICSMALPPGDLSLPQQFMSNLEQKRGIFSIL